MSLRDGILWSLAAVLLLTVGSPPLQAQEEEFAPADQAAFDDLAVGQRMALDDNIFSSFYYVDFVAHRSFQGNRQPPGDIYGKLYLSEHGFEYGNVNVQLR